MAGSGCFFSFPSRAGVCKLKPKSVPVGWAHFFFLSRCAQGCLVPERKLEAAGQVTRGVGDYIAVEPAHAGRGRAGSERGGWVRPQDPRGRRSEAEAAGARAGHECPVVERPRLPSLRGDAQAGGPSNVTRRPQWREQPPQRPPRQCSRAEARSLPAPRRPPARGRPTSAPGCRRPDELVLREPAVLQVQGGGCGGRSHGGRGHQSHLLRLSLRA